MDRTMINKQVKELFDKYKYVLLIIGLGILFMSIPEDNGKQAQEIQPAPQIAQKGRAEELEQILGQISGVGKVKVMLTEAAGAETIYQTDEDRTATKDSERTDIQTVVIAGSDRQEQGLIRTVTPPVYLGAIIVCQGGDSSAVRLAIVEAVSNATGISSDRISVLKMK